ncbi:MAG: NAD-dependent epimerase/dehydratase family protein [Polyangiaceae bacterium]|nr:NAD-dependent epimerase/dehydratase family protein [Polyangiaceae bacterium]
MSHKRLFITGGTGFLGRYVVDELLARGHEVVALVRNPSEAALPDGVVTVTGDILDAASVEAAAAGCEAVFHCAGKVSRDPADAEVMHKVHVEGTKTVLDAVRRAGVKRAVVASTSGTIAVTTDPDDIRDETASPPTDLIGKWPYYRSKLYAEMAALDRNDPPNFEVVVVSPTLLLGPGDVHGSSTGDVADFIDGRIPAVPGGGLSFVDARDAAQAMVLAWENGQAGERYLVAAQNLTMATFCGKLERISGVRAPAARVPRSVLLAKASAYLDRALAKRTNVKPRLDETSLEMAQYYWYVDSTKAREQLGWVPRDPQDTLADTVRDLRDRGVVWG